MKPSKRTPREAPVVDRAALEAATTLEEVLAATTVRWSSRDNRGVDDDHPDPRRRRS
jgi:hypothetical protein